MSQLSPLFARQAIYDTKKNVVAYELLFRHNEDNYANVVDGDSATSHVLLNVFGSHRIDEIVGAHKAFVNFTRNLIINPPRLAKNRLVVEVLEDIEIDREMMVGLAKLKNAGYEIALDDFFISKETKRLVNFANIIKIDVLALELEMLERYVDTFRNTDVKLLAEKVEDNDTFQLCLALGFDLFQGYFLCKPEIIEGVRVDEGRQSVLKLVSTLNNPEVEFDEVVTTVATDAALSYKLLRLVNSSAIGIPRKIQSLSQAVSLLGFKTIKNWATFLLMANRQDKPRELCVITMCRAKFCESLGLELSGKSLGESGFTAGLLSNLDAFLDMHLDTILQHLSLADDIESALTTRTGELGKLLDIALHYERGQWNEVDWAFLSDHNISPVDLNRFYGDSVIWATQIVQEQT